MPHLKTGAAWQPRKSGRRNNRSNLFNQHCSRLALSRRAFFFAPLRRTATERRGYKVLKVDLEIRAGYNGSL